ncbi:hypothetical protein [Paraburkholderia sp. Cpub6]|uniref:hypothetical protein n=1 Tax=Paraburkholderia sp. Cpub6 TaxID=2723094 RepID=UPI00161BFB76|nr:hypothetical protein [Paraburkholderia sp. Cpub6]MBB5457758.1 hypothetical protein [Paraburkholderia sp. Cpub6]
MEYCWPHRRPPRSIGRFASEDFVAVDIIQAVLNWTNNNAGLSGWVQAIGSILAVVSAFMFPWLQSRKDRRLRESERRTSNLALAATVRAIADEADEALRDLTRTFDHSPEVFLPEDFRATFHRMEWPNHPRATMFRRTMDDLLERISALSQRPSISDGQLSELVEIRRCLKDAWLLFDGVQNPYREFDTKDKNQCYAILNRASIVRGATSAAYDALTETE